MAHPRLAAAGWEEGGVGRSSFPQLSWAQGSTETVWGTAPSPLPAEVSPQGPFPLSSGSCWPWNGKEGGCWCPPRAPPLHRGCQGKQHFVQALEWLCWDKESVPRDRELQPRGLVLPPARGSACPWDEPNSCPGLSTTSHCCVPHSVGTVRAQGKGTLSKYEEFLPALCCSGWLGVL